MSRENGTVTVPLRVSQFPASPQDIDEGRCLACDGYLELSQPDVGSPERMVGLCERCGRWHLIDLVPGAGEAVSVLLPEAEDFRDALVARAARDRKRPA